VFAAAKNFCCFLGSYLFGQSEGLDQISGQDVLGDVWLLRPGSTKRLFVNRSHTFIHYGAAFKAFRVRLVPKTARDPQCVRE
jgi:hypothetical protein